METVALQIFQCLWACGKIPTSQYSGVLSKFITLMLAGQAPTIFGAGDQSSRLHVRRQRRASEICLHRRAPAENVTGHTFNIATGVRFTLKQVLRRPLKTITRLRQGEPKYEADRIGDVKHSLADISAAAEHVRATIQMCRSNRGLRRTVDWYRSQASNCRDSSANAHDTRAAKRCAPGGFEPGSPNLGHSGCPTVRFSLSAQAQSS